MTDGELEQRERRSGGIADVGWLRFEAAPVYNRADYGFAVKFVDVPPETMTKLDRAIDLLRFSGRSAL